MVTPTTILDPTILEHLKRNRLLREGHFVYRSGRHSAALLDRDRLLADPAAASRMGYALAKRFFIDHIETVAAPSIWGAGLAQWVGYFLEPKAKVVYATPVDGSVEIAEHLIDHIAGKRVLLIDNLVMTGETIRQFLETMDRVGATVLGVGALWNAASPAISDRPVPGLLNLVYEAFAEDACPICDAGGPEPEVIPY